jgi:tRNA/rRNA methyltransferase
MYNSYSLTNCIPMHQPAFILIKPQFSKNIGSIARIMLNFGLIDLRIINPPANWLNDDTIKLSSGAYHLLKKAKIFQSIIDSIHDIKISFSTTSQMRNIVKNIYTPEQAISNIQHFLSYKNFKSAFLFGPEKYGLSNNDISLSQGIIKIPVNPKFTSLNIAQSVAVIAYEWNKQNNLFLPKTSLSNLNFKKIYSSKLFFKKQFI